VNPFRYTQPIRAGEDLIDRATEINDLLTWAAEGTNARLVAPRRYGKTSLLDRVLADAHAIGGWVTAYVDFFGVISVGDVAERIEEAYSHQLTGTLASWFQGIRRGFRPTLQVGVPGVTVGGEVDLHHNTGLLDRLDLPERIARHGNTRVLVVFDEFQQVLSAHERIDEVIRSRIQHHADVSYIFAGSQVGMLNELFNDPRRAFYAQARPLPLGPLPADEIAVYVDSAFTTTGKQVGAAIGPILDVAAGHPQRTMFLAHHTWEATPDGGTADEATFATAYDGAMSEEAEAFRAVWNTISVNERRVLTRISNNVEALTTRRSAIPMPRSSAVHAALTLTRNAFILEDATAVSGYRLADPLLARWVNAGRRPD
jgi:uncharacterized protein